MQVKKIANPSTDAHYDRLLKENARLQERIVTLEVEIDSLKNKNSAIMKEIDQRAHAVFLQHVARIKQASDQAVKSKVDGSKPDGVHT